MKKALDAAAVIATVTIAGWNYQQNKEVELSDLAMENVEALAQGESDEDFNEATGCYATICSKVCGPYIYASKTDCSCDLCN